MKFTAKEDSKGRVQYRKDGKLISKEEYELSTSDSIAEAQPEPESDVQTQEKICVVCGAPGDSTRYLNQQVIYLCSEDYQAKTLGEVASYVNK